MQPPPNQVAAAWGLCEHFFFILPLVWQEKGAIDQLITRPNVYGMPSSRLQI